MREVYVVVLLVLTAMNAALLFINLVFAIKDRKRKLSSLHKQLQKMSSVWCLLNGVPCVYALFASSQDAFYVCKPLVLFSTVLPVAYMCTFVKVSIKVNNKIQTSKIPTVAATAITVLLCCHATVTFIICVLLYATPQHDFLLKVLFWSFFFVVYWLIFLMAALASRRLTRAVRESALTSMSNLKRVRQHMGTLVGILVLMNILFVYQLVSLTVDNDSSSLTKVIIPVFLMTLMTFAGTCGAVLTRAKKSFKMSMAFKRTKAVDFTSGVPTKAINFSRRNSVRAIGKYEVKRTQVSPQPRSPDEEDAEIKSVPSITSGPEPTISGDGLKWAQVKTKLQVKSKRNSQPPVSSRWALAVDIVQELNNMF